MAGWRHLQAYLRFLAVPQHRRPLVVYSEGASYWPHLGPVVKALLEHGQLPIAYVSSSQADPGVQLSHPLLSSWVIGDGHVRTLFFSSLKAEVVLMTMPDLQTFHIKRSAGVRRYVYLHHSLVSSHMAYRDGAFDHFDAVLCAGPHHVEELRAIEALKGLPAKELVPHGYGRLDALLADLHGAIQPDSARPTVVVAPSWGANGLIERHAEALMRGLAGSRWSVIVRPHPQTLRLAPQAVEKIRDWCRRAPNLRLEESVVGHESLQKAHVMISDWSGAAFDFALAFERPVLFVDVPRKINNPEYGRIALDPLEVSAREVLGAVAASDDPGGLIDALECLYRNLGAKAQAIREFRDRRVFHVGGSADVAARYLLSLLSASGPRGGR